MAVMAHRRMKSRRTQPAAKDSADPGFPLDQKLHSSVEKSPLLADWRRRTEPRAVKLPMNT